MLKYAIQHEGTIRLYIKVQSESQNAEKYTNICSQVQARYLYWTLLLNKEQNNIQTRLPWVKTGWKEEAEVWSKMKSLGAEERILVKQTFPLINTTNLQAKFFEINKKHWFIREILKFSNMNRLNATS